MMDLIDDIANSDQFNGIELLSNTGTVTLQIGADSGSTLDIQAVDVRTITLGLQTDAIDNPGATRLSLDHLVTATDQVATARASLGADINRLRSVTRSIDTYAEKLSASESRIRDADIALEAATLARTTILRETAVSVMAQARIQPEIALQLLNFTVAA